MEKQTQHVVPHSGQWAVRKEGADRVTSVHKTQQQATETARRIAGNQGADVVVCNHVLYNVPDIIEFVSALSDHATRRVVMEITATHPLTSMKPLWLAIHGLERPNGPTADDAYDVIRAMGIPARMERSARKHEESDEDRAARVALARRRLCVGSERDGEIAALLLEESREVVTIWWDT